MKDVRPDDEWAIERLRNAAQAARPYGYANLTAKEALEVAESIERCRHIDKQRAERAEKRIAAAKPILDKYVESANSEFDAAWDILYETQGDLEWQDRIAAAQNDNLPYHFVGLLEGDAFDRSVVEFKEIIDAILDGPRRTFYAEYFRRAE